MSYIDPQEIEVNNVLGHDYEDYLSEMYGMALVNPAKYQKMRTEALRKIKREAIKALYKTIFNVLNKGEIGGANLFLDGDGTALKPRYPGQKINDFSMSASATMDNILKDLCDIVIPPQMNGVMNDKLNKIGKSTLL